MGETISVTFKTPDAVDDELNDIEDEELREQFKKLTKKFVRYGEYITVEFDLKDGTATVVS